MSAPEEITPGQVEAEWIYEILRRAMLARSCLLINEAHALCNVAENRYVHLIKHATMEVRMRLIYAGIQRTIDEVRNIISHDFFWKPQSLVIEFSNLLFDDNDTNIETENL